MNKIDGLPQEVGFVFIHGAGLNSGIWSKTVESFGYPYLLVDYPNRSGRHDAGNKLTLADYTAYMHEQIKQWGIQRFILVAHSLGGVLALRLAEAFKERIAGFIAIGAIIPSKGNSFLSTLPMPNRILMHALLRMIGTRPPKSAIRAGICHDLTEEQAAELIDGYIPESLRVYLDRSDSPVPPVKKLYVKLSNDKELSPAMQNKMIANLEPHAVQSMNTGHLPMLGNPAQLRELLQSFLTYSAEAP
ncbi:pimeloyl-ACP methyl ester carboxylesterase [Paenibacillus endophyticus]|uniref:Pimeloyl-ACP methyl ester carboxylesterase n=1 Tax=Paenibacillus endophyticus TaxID=1294268 RepID=A0A7W5C3A2_9BACL|nr:alpha/beta hydrolase [Paenibacillus endophyticus]MBB3150276.1 pimeloyl-ACP methyl ester carboxylesterase [Paenibacillus endophyticus]